MENLYIQVLGVHVLNTHCALFSVLGTPQEQTDGHPALDAATARGAQIAAMPPDSVLEEAQIRRDTGPGRRRVTECRGGGGARYQLSESEEEKGRAAGSGGHGLRAQGRGQAGPGSPRVHADARRSEPLWDGLLNLWEEADIAILP